MSDLKDCCFSRSHKRFIKRLSKLAMGWMNRPNNTTVSQWSAGIIICERVFVKTISSSLCVHYSSQWERYFKLQSTARLLLNLCPFLSLMRSFLLVIPLPHIFHFFFCIILMCFIIRMAYLSCTLKQALIAFPPLCKRVLFMCFFRGLTKGQIVWMYLWCVLYHHSLKNRQTATGLLKVRRGHRAKKLKIKDRNGHLKVVCQILNHTVYILYTSVKWFTFLFVHE